MAFDPKRPPGLEVRAVAAGVRIGMGIIPGRASTAAPRQPIRIRSADKHLQYPVLVGHGGVCRARPDHLLLGHVHQAAQDEMLNLSSGSPHRAARTGAVLTSILDSPNWLIAW
jgi:hypothetical protein